ncbi:cellulose biosynthesis protein BcsC [Stutzerimonas stutzeri]|jgi:cellulose synthase operon protein C|uniref:Tetratricopeptide repeat protein n=1 Tax=Stutzerimonas stutzeri TaxID=316 RepID=A0A5S5B932_STUST|nr:cellulose biosynthesis protein BcsC [Stutzerimonas stutzeri]TYP63581.1 tetratricopeptide repeat protein [Stutzerimonas stutzeri]
MFRYHALTFGLLAALGLPTAHAQDDPQQLLIRQGHFWQAQEKPERAAEAWNRLLELDAAQVDALYGLGAIALDKGNTAQARKYLARLQAVEPLPPQALQLEQDIHLSSSVNSKALEEARLLVDNGERAQAAQHYRQLLGKREPQGLIAREFYNNLGFLDEHWTEARAGLERLVRERPDDSIAALFLAQQLARRESTRPEGIRALAKLTAREDIQGYAEEGWRLALTWIAEPKPADAPLFEHYLKTHPDDEEIHALLAKARKAPAKPAAWKPDPDVARGLAALDRRDLARAEEAFAKRLKASPNDPDALGGLGVVRQQQDKLEDAEFLLTKAVRQPRGGSWKKALGEVRYWRLLDSSRQATGNAALALVQQAIALQPNNPEGLRQRANIHLADGNFVQAEADYRQVLQRKPADADAQRGLIDTMVQAGRTEEALTLIDQLPTESRDALGNLGELRANQAMQRARIAEAKGDQAGARQALEQALQHDPNNAWARFALARIYLQLGAVPEARSLIDGLLTSNPDDPQALYVSALLSAELGEWQKADEALRRIPVSARTADIQQLASDTTFQLQLQQISQLSAAGRKQDARVFLARTVPLAEGRPVRQLALAQAYADAGDPMRAMTMMRDLLARSPDRNTGLTLQYIGVLLSADQDAEAASLMRTLQAEPLDAAQRWQYEDLLHIYRVRQADRLREQGDLVAAYDMLSPALIQRPQDALANAALARMYTDSGTPAKALELYRPLLQRNPADAQLQLGAAEAATQAGEHGFADNAIQQALRLAPADAEVLTAAANMYRRQGKTKQAAELLKQVVAQEKRQERAAYTATTVQQESTNPFLGLPGQTGQRLQAADPLAPVPTAPDRLASATSQLASQAGVAGNPFAVPPKPTDPRANLSPAARALAEISEARSPYLVQGLQVSGNDSESGLGRLTRTEAPAEANLPMGNARIAVRVTPVALNASGIGEDARSRFGAGPLASADSPGSQKASGVGIGVAYAHEGIGLKADLGTTPLGFLYDTTVGGVSLERPIGSTGNAHWKAGASRRAVTDSLLSFAGTEDKRTGQQWGGVTANGVRGELGYDDGNVGTYGYAAAHVLKGNNVSDNNRAELGGGVYWYLSNTEDQKLTLGASSTAFSYSENQSYYTYGHGGYFSPQTFFALSMPVSWSQRYERFSYQLKGSVGLQFIDQDDADYFPNDSDLQAAASGVLGRPAVHAGSSKTSLGYSLYGAGEYRMTPNFVLGGHLGLDNAQDYRQWNTGLYLRYLFEDQTGPMALPISPYTSPYAN